MNIFKKKLLVYGYYHSNNFGDIFMLSAITKNLEKEIRFNTNSKLASMEGDRLFVFLIRALFSGKRILKPFNRFIKLILKFYLKLNYFAIFLVGGTHIQESQRSKIQESLSELVIFFSLCKSAHIPLFFFSIGINNLKNPINRLNAKKIMDLAKKIYVRDKISLKNAREIGLRGNNIIVGSDASFLMLKDYQIRKVNNFSPRKRHFILNIVDLNRWQFPDDLIDSFYRSIFLIIEKLHLINGNITLLLTEKDADLLVLEKFKDRVDDIYIFENKIEETIELLQSCSASLMQRYHLVLCCVALSIPIVVPIYHEKVQNLISEMAVAPLNYSIKNFVKNTDFVLKEMISPTIIPKFDQNTFDQASYAFNDLLKNLKFEKAIV